MNRIALIVPYFGSLPDNTQLWLESCRYNRTVDWLLYTDDKTNYDYPENVKVNYCSFESMKRRIQDKIPFRIVCERPYKLCDFRVAFGAIFAEELADYDYWGYCDMDVLWGNIRKFITDQVLNDYEKIGFQGHLTIYKNTMQVKERYKTVVEGVSDYRDIFTRPETCCFDEDGIDRIYGRLGLPVYREVHFVHLAKYCSDFYICHLPQEVSYRNKDQIFTWDKGVLMRLFLEKGKVKEEEFMYIHFFCRDMTLKIRNCSSPGRLVIYPNVIKESEECINAAYVKKKAHTSKLLFRLKYLYRNRRKISPGKLVESYVLYRKMSKRWKI